MVRGGGEVKLERKVEGGLRGRVEREVEREG